MKMTLVWLIVALAALTVGWMAGTSANDHRSAAREIVSYHTVPTIEQVQALSCLVTTRVDVADVQETRLDGYTGGMKAALLIKGDFLLGVDLSRAKFESVDESNRTAVLVLLQPQVTSPRLDHERTRIFAVVETGVWQITPGGGSASAVVIDRAFRDAQRVVKSACNDPTLMTRSRQQAEQVLGAFFKATGWTVKIRWTD